MAIDELKTGRPNYLKKVIKEEGATIHNNQEDYFFKRLRPWQFYLKDKLIQLKKEEKTNEYNE